MGQSCEPEFFKAKTGRIGNVQRGFVRPIYHHDNHAKRLSGEQPYNHGKRHPIGRTGEFEKIIEDVIEKAIEDVIEKAIEDVIDLQGQA